MSAGTAYAVDAARHAQHAERHALALLDRELSAEDRAAILEGLQFHNAAKERLRDAEALARYQAGEPVWAWPSTAPWAGFGVAS